MSEPAAPWWADVQHLRPREDRASEPVEPRRFHRTGARRPVEWPSEPAPRSTEPAREDAAVATLEHEVPSSNPWLGDEAPGADAAWADTFGTSDAPRDTFSPHDMAGAVGEPGGASTTGPLWDDSLEQAFASTPSWDEDDEWLLPKGADRIENGRRTIEIRGQVDRVVGVSAPAETAAATRTGRRRPTRRPAERLAGRPDRVAMWAFLLGILLILVAALSNPGDADAAVQAATLLAG